MKSVFLVLTAFVTLTACGQGGDKSKRPSPPAKASETITSGAVVTVDYSQPSVKGRTIGKDLEPMPGKVWRAGANEATTFEVSKDVKVEGKPLPAGKYSLFTIMNGEDWTFIFNKTWEQWGAYNYKEGDDALRVNVKAGKSSSFAEKLLYTVDKSGNVWLEWGAIKAGFKVE